MKAQGIVVHILEYSLNSRFMWQIPSSTTFKKPVQLQVRCFFFVITFFQSITFASSTILGEKKAIFSLLKLGYEMGIRKILETTETNKINDRRFYIPTRVRNKPKFLLESSWSEQN